MRLGIDASNLRAGGGVTHLLALLSVARPEDYGITGVVVWGGGQTLKQLPDRPWLELVHEPMLDRSLPYRLYWQKVKLSQLAERSCDVLFVPGGFYKGTFKPFVTMSRNLLPFAREEMNRYGASWMFLRIFLLRSAQAKSFRQADGLIFLNEYAHSAVMKHVNNIDGRCAIIPHGVNEEFRVPPRAQRPISDYSQTEPFRVVYISIVDVYKHQWHVAEAVAGLRQAGAPVILDLIGPDYPPALRRLRGVIQRLDPKEEFIHYKGTIPHSDLAEYYRRADCFVFASSCENMPNILLEAMASGLPIACSNRGSMPEILGDAGAYFDPERPDEIAEALRALIEDQRLRENYAAQAYERAQAYSWERCARETFSFISQFGSRANGRSA